MVYFIHWYTQTEIPETVLGPKTVLHMAIKALNIITFNNLFFYRLHELEIQSISPTIHFSFHHKVSQLLAYSRHIFQETRCQSWTTNSWPSYANGNLFCKKVMLFFWKFRGLALLKHFWRYINLNLLGYCIQVKTKASCFFEYLLYSIVLCAGI